MIKPDLCWLLIMILSIHLTEVGTFTFYSESMGYNLNLRGY